MKKRIGWIVITIMFVMGSFTLNCFAATAANTTSGITFFDDEEVKRDGTDDSDRKKLLPKTNNDDQADYTQGKLLPKLNNTASIISILGIGVIVIIIFTKYKRYRNR